MSAHKSSSTETVRGTVALAGTHQHARPKGQELSCSTGSSFDATFQCQRSDGHCDRGSKYEKRGEGDRCTVVGPLLLKQMGKSPSWAREHEQQQQKQQEEEEGEEQQTRNQNQRGKLQNSGTANPPSEPASSPSLSSSSSSSSSWDSSKDDDDTEPGISFRPLLRTNRGRPPPPVIDEEDFFRALYANRAAFEQDRLRWDRKMVAMGWWR
jgi:hypothetical protein